MSSKAKLADALEKAGLPNMAERARAGFYHDFESPLDDPAMQLARELMRAIQAGNIAAAAVRKQHHDGAFDATPEESERWARSPAGRDTFERLLGGFPPEARQEEVKTAVVLRSMVEAAIEAVPGIRVVVLMQRGGNPGFDCATTISRDELIPMLRNYADTLEANLGAPRHDA
jgi:hypothetical protein